MTWSKERVLERLAAYPAERGRRSNEDAETDDLDDDQRNPFVRGDQPLRPAAVLVPLVNREDEVTVLLTKRTEHLSKHAGQISFPAAGWMTRTPGQSTQRFGRPKKRSASGTTRSKWSPNWMTILWGQDT